MKRCTIVLLILTLVASCKQQDDKLKQMQATIDSLQARLDETYRPGLGEFMSGIQIHHAKLWFAGKDQNWGLAEFEVDEIREAMENIRKYCKDRPEIAKIYLIEPALDSLSLIISQKNSASFQNSFTVLTNTCNRCHRETDHGFNVVTIPASLPVGNQEFKPADK